MTISAPDSAPVDRSTVLAWMAEHGRGYKAAAAEFGIPRSTIQGWAHAERDAGKPRPQAPKARPCARARATPPEPIVEEPWDPTTCDRETWLRRGMVRAMELSRSEHLEGHSGNAVRWETLAIRYRDELDALLEEQRLAGKLPSPVNLPQVSRDVGELLPSLVAVDPDSSEAWVLQAVAELAKHKGGKWAAALELLRGGE